MNHPGPEEWVPYLYGECPAETRQALKAHLDSCSDCRTRLVEWRGDLKRLDAWKLPRAQAPFRVPMPTAAKWAFAGLVLLLAGFAVGRVGFPGADVAQLRASLEPELRRTLLQELAVVAREEANQAAANTTRVAEQEAARIAAAYVKGLEAQRAEDRRTIEAALDRLEAQRVTDLATLKRELDTLALNTDASLRHTAEGLVLLANYRSTPSGPDPSHSSTQ